MTTIAQNKPRINVSNIQEVYFRINRTYNFDNYDTVNVQRFVVSKAGKTYSVTKELYNQVVAALTEANIQLERSQNAFGWQVA